MKGKLIEFIVLLRDYINMRIEKYLNIKNWIITWKMKIMEITEENNKRKTWMKREKHTLKNNNNMEKKTAQTYKSNIHLLYF